jgi:hypothetical protein
MSDQDDGFNSIEHTQSKKRFDKTPHHTICWRMNDRTFL